MMKGPIISYAGFWSGLFFLCISNVWHNMNCQPILLNSPLPELVAFWQWGALSSHCKPCSKCAIPPPEFPGATSSCQKLLQGEFYSISLYIANLAYLWIRLFRQVKAAERENKSGFVFFNKSANMFTRSTQNHQTWSISSTISWLRSGSWNYFIFLSMCINERKGIKSQILA